MTNDPVLIAYAVQRGRDRKKVRYTRIGRAYPHDTGQGLTLILEALPLKFDGKIVLLELDEADDRRLLADAKRYERERKANSSKGTGKEEKE